MPTTRAYGTDGACAITGHNIVFNAWSITTTQSVQRVTGYGDTFASKKGGIKDATGTAAGGLKYDGASSTPGIVTPVTALGEAATLTVATGCTYTGTTILTNTQIQHNFEQGVTFSTNLDFAAAPTETWDETP